MAEQTAEQKAEQTALKSLQRLSELVDRPEIEAKLVRVVADDPTSIGIIDTASYENRQERILIVQPTTIPDVVELWYQDAAGYEGLVGTLTLAKDGQKGVR